LLIYHLLPSTIYYHLDHPNQIDHLPLRLPTSLHYPQLYCQGPYSKCSCCSKQRWRWHPSRLFCHFTTPARPRPPNECI